MKTAIINLAFASVFAIVSLPTLALFGLVDPDVLVAMLEVLTKNF